MKIAALVTAAALACGTAFAGQTEADAQKSSTTASNTQTEAKGEGIAVKTKRAFHRMGDKLRSIGHKDKDTQQAKGSDTSTMGAGAEDSGRRARMDSAYSNWQKKQQK